MPEKLSPEYLEDKEKEKRRYPFDVVFVLGGGLAKIRDKFYPTDYRHGDEFGMLGAGIRMTAAIELYLNKQAKNFVFSTGRSEKTKAVFGQDVPTEAKTYKEKFLRCLEGLKKRNDYQEKFEDLEDPEIILEENSVTTMTNIKEMLEILQENKWQKIAVVSSDYHIPRIKALYERVLAKYPDIMQKLKFLSAEEVVKEYKPGKYDEAIKKFYQTSEAKKRIKNERQGVEDLRSGKYAPGEFQLTKDKK